METNKRPDSMARINTPELAQAFIDEQVAALRAQVADKKVLLVLPETNVNLQLSCRNIPSIKPVLAQNVCTYDLMNASAVVMVEGAENVLNVMLA